VFDLTFTVIDRKGGAVPLTLPIEQAVIAGWTGRDPIARDKQSPNLKRSALRGRQRRRSITAARRGGSRRKIRSKPAGKIPPARRSSS